MNTLNSFKVIFYLCLFSVNFTFAQNISQLSLNQPTEQTIKGGETQSFSVQLLQNQTARIEIEQRGTDVSLAGYKPNGERFVEMESPSGLLGNDLILLVADDIGEYKVSVSPADPKAALGKYVIKLSEIRSSTVEDRKIIEVSKQITKLADETTTLRTNGTREGRRQALEKWNEIIALSKIKKDRIWEVVATLSMGLINEQLGEFQKALDLYEQSLSHAREIGNRQYEGSSLNNSGNSYATLGNYELAIFYLNQAIVLQREVGNKRGESINLNNLGTAELLSGNYNQARLFYEQSLPLRREVKDQRGEANTLTNLGQVFVKLGDNQKALEFYKSGYEIRKTISDKQGEVNSIWNIAKLNWKIGDKTKAFEEFTQANLLANKLGDRRVEADSFYWLALAENDKNNSTKALENIEKGLQIIEQIRGELLSPELKSAYFSTVQQYYELYVELLVAKGEISNNKADIGLALEVNERARTRSLIELLQEARINFKQGVSEKLLDKERELQDNLNAKYRQRTTLLGGKNTPEQITKINNEINDLAVGLNDLQTQIRRENPRYASLKNSEPLSVQEIQNLLDDETVLIEYKLGEKRSFAWIVSKESIKLYNLPTRFEIEKLAKNYYSIVSDPIKSKNAKAAESAEKLSDILISQFSANIKNKRLAIVADGILQFIPFATFTENETIILPSAGVLAELRQAKSSPNSKEISIFADPVFDARDSRLKTINIETKSNEMKHLLRDFTDSEKLPRLLSSRFEAKNISTFFQKNKIDVQIDFAANKENAISENLANYRILHFATHGLLNTTHPQFSGLVLSLYDKNGKPQDGFLRLNQIYNLNLNSDLVVLSACQTALGKEVRGEGLIGLTRGFMYAGARRIVSTLWKVDDAATAEFMKTFYQNLLVKKLKPATALRQTQTEMREIPRFKSPYFWAGFTIQGDWK